MNTTVAVALITSLSTLGGGFIGSTTSVIINRTQTVREKAAKRREIRRAAYLQFLNRFDEMVSLLDKCWMLRPVPKGANASDEILAARDGLSVLESAMNVVQLEGPTEILDTAQKTYELLSNEYLLLLDVMIDNSEISDKLAFELSDGKYSKARDSRPIAKKEFTDAARKILD